MYRLDFTVIHYKCILIFQLALLCGMRSNWQDILTLNFIYIQCGQTYQKIMKTVINLVI